MSNVQGTIASQQRLEWLTARLEAEGTVTIADAAAQLQVSEMTIRRDLAELEERGEVRRVRGGARAVGPQPFARRQHTATRAKARIAAKLSPLIPPVGAVAFDASSTVMRLVPGLEHATDLTVLTNGPDTFHALQDVPGVQALLTGGRLEPRTGSLVGPLACRAAAVLSIGMFVASAAAVDPRSGGLEASLEEAEVKRAIAAGAAQVVLAVDSTKLGMGAVAVGVDWDRIDLLVTELATDHEALAPYRELAEIL